MSNLKAWKGKVRSSWLTDHQLPDSCAYTKVNTVYDSFHVFPNSGNTVISPMIPLFTRSPTALCGAVCPTWSVQAAEIVNIGDSHWVTALELLVLDAIMKHILENEKPPMNVKCVSGVWNVKTDKHTLLFQFPGAMSRGHWQWTWLSLQILVKISPDLVQIVAEVISMSSWSSRSNQESRLPDMYQLTRHSSWLWPGPGWLADSSWTLKCQFPAGFSRARKEGWTVHIRCVRQWSRSWVWIFQWSSMDRKQWTTNTIHDAVHYPMVLPIWKSPRT